MYDRFVVGRQRWLVKSAFFSILNFVSWISLKVSMRILEWS